MCYNYVTFGGTEEKLICLSPFYEVSKPGLNHYYFDLVKGGFYSLKDDF